MQKNKRTGSGTHWNFIMSEFLECRFHSEQNSHTQIPSVNQLLYLLWIYSARFWVHFLMMIFCCTVVPFKGKTCLLLKSQKMHFQSPKRVSLKCPPLYLIHAGEEEATGNCGLPGSQSDLVWGGGHHHAGGREAVDVSEHSTREAPREGQPTATTDF